MNTLVKSMRTPIMLLLLAAWISPGSLASAKEPRPVRNQQDSIPTALKAFEGHYQWQEHQGMFVNILIRDGKLVLKQLWDEKEMTFERKDDLNFISSGVFPIKFIKDKSGKVKQMLALNKDVWDMVKDYPPKQ